MLYRTSEHETISLHLFNVIAVVDRIKSTMPVQEQDRQVGNDDVEVGKFIPSVDEQDKLMNQLVFIFATSVIENIPQLKQIMQNIYPKHLDHTHSQSAGLKTKQVHVHTISNY